MHYDLLDHENYVRIYVYFVSFLFVMSTLRPQNTLICVQLDFYKWHPLLKERMYMNDI